MPLTAVDGAVSACDVPGASAESAAKSNIEAGRAARSQPPVRQPMLSGVFSEAGADRDSVSERKRSVFGSPHRSNRRVQLPETHDCHHEASETSLSPISLPNCNFTSESGMLGAAGDADTSSRSTRRLRQGNADDVARVRNFATRWKQQAMPSSPSDTSTWDSPLSGRPREPVSPTRGAPRLWQRSRFSRMIEADLDEAEESYHRDCGGDGGELSPSRAKHTKVVALRPVRHSPTNNGEFHWICGTSMPSPKLPSLANSSRSLSDEGWMHEEADSGDDAAASPADVRAVESQESLPRELLRTASGFEESTWATLGNSDEDEDAVEVVRTDVQRFHRRHSLMKTPLDDLHGDQQESNVLQSQQRSRLSKRLAARVLNCMSPERRATKAAPEQQWVSTLSAPCGNRRVSFFSEGDGGGDAETSRRSRFGTAPATTPPAADATPSVAARDAGQRLLQLRPTRLAHLQQRVLSNLGAASDAPPQSPVGRAAPPAAPREAWGA